MAIQDEPYCEIPAEEFAAWIEGQGDRWWSVDGDPILTGRLPFPCPGDELAAEIRKIGRPVLVLDPRDPPEAKNEVANAGVLDALAKRPWDSIVWDSIDVPHGGKEPAWAKDRLWDLRWKGSGVDWVLLEDTEAAEMARRDAAQAKAP